MTYSLCKETDKSYLVTYAMNQMLTTVIFAHTFP